MLAVPGVAVGIDIDFDVVVAAAAATAAAVVVVAVAVVVVVASEVLLKYEKLTRCRFSHFPALDTKFTLAK